MTKNNSGLRKLDGFLSAIFKSLFRVFIKILIKKTPLSFLFCSLGELLRCKVHLHYSAFLFDSKKKEIAFFRKLFADRQREPTDPEFIERQLIETLKGYYFQ